MGGFTYTAFITYSHADAKIASWLQKELETYVANERGEHIEAAVAVGYPL